MSQIKVNYGIDLGTTNSAIARIEDGVPAIKKIDGTYDTMPSCVYFPKNKGCRVGKLAYDSMKSDKKRSMKRMDADASNTFLEFKRTMGTDKKYSGPNTAGREYSSEDLSAEVLKTLKSFITDDTIRAAVITVPAKFTVNQKTATIEAARKAGFSQVELLQEPIAAAMAYGLTSDCKDGYWLVFDFGGGTFDAALLKVEEGIIQVTDTEGDNYLGGKNLDYAVVDNILLPYLSENYSMDDTLGDPGKRNIVREALKVYAEEIKNALSFKEEYEFYTDPGDIGEDEDGEEIEFDLTVTREKLHDAIRDVFAKAVDICKKLLEKNNLTNGGIDKLILVGGPTHSPLIREMLREEVSPNLDCSINPMTVVAEGAALYASTIDRDIPEEGGDEDARDIRLDISYDATTIETEVFIPVKIKSGAENVTVRFVRGDNVWESEKMEVDMKGNVAVLHLRKGVANTFAVECFDSHGDRLQVFPDSISIIQGSKVGNATLPYDISVAVYNKAKERDVMAHISGLERNKTLPATGVRNGLHTNVRVRAGVETDILRIPIYQADRDSEGSAAVFYELVATVEINGDDIPESIQRNADVDLIVKVDRNEQMTVEAYFPEQDITVKKSLDTSVKQTLDDAGDFVSNYLPMARKDIDRLRTEGHDVAQLQRRLYALEAEFEINPEPKKSMQNLKELMREIERLTDMTEWDRIENNLRTVMLNTVNASLDSDDYEAKELLRVYRKEYDRIVAKKNIKQAKELYSSFRNLHFRMTRLASYTSYILSLRHAARDNWTDPERAGELIKKGLHEIENHPTISGLEPIIRELLKLQKEPENEKPSEFGSGLS